MTEKGDYMVRNAQLSQQLTTAQQKLSEQRSDLESQIVDKDEIIENQQESIVKLQEQLAELENKVLVFWSFFFSSDNFIDSRHYLTCVI